MRFTLFTIFIFALIPSGLFAQKVQVLVGGKPKFNIRSQKEITIGGNGSQQLIPRNTIDVSGVVELIYRPRTNVFVGCGLAYGVHTYRLTYISNYELLGYTGEASNYLGLASHTFLNSNLNAGYSFNMGSSFKLDFGVGINLEPGIDYGVGNVEISRYDANNVKERVVRTTETYRNDPQVYQSIFTRLLIRNSKRKFLNHFVIGMGYNSKFFNRNSPDKIVHAVYTKADKTTFSNDYYDHKQSLYVSFQYSFNL